MLHLIVNDSDDFIRSLHSKCGLKFEGFATIFVHELELSIQVA